jgi:translation initiation factor IF-1
LNKEDRMIFSGVVIDTPRNFFKVRLESGQEILCTITGNIRRNEIRIHLGDSVEVEISPYDMDRGRIVRRAKIVR